MGYASQLTEDVPHPTTRFKHYINKPFFDVATQYWSYAGTVPEYEHPDYTDKPTGYVSGDPYDTTIDAISIFAIVFTFIWMVGAANERLREERQHKIKAMYRMRIFAS